MAHGTSGSSTSSRAAVMGRYVGGDTEWEAKEALRQRELEEARARAAQMEKTMRWWSDCTANWREKWSKVRNERNKAREEAKMLRSKLDASLKDINTYKRERQELEAQNEQMRKELEKIHLLLLKHAGQWDHKLLEALESVDSEKDISTDDHANENTTTGEDDRTSAEKDSGIEEYVLQGAVPKHAVELYDGKDSLLERDIDCDSNTVGDHDTLSTIGTDAESLMKRTCKKDAFVSSPDEEEMRQKLSMLQLRLDEATKTLQVEREEKLALHRNLERLEMELAESKEKCEDLRVSRQEAVRELLQLQDQHQDTVALIQADLMDEATSREGMDRRLADLRAQLERLQAENAAEWGKRERLETEKLNLERDNKKLRSELRDAQERLERRGRPTTTADTELRQLQQEVSDRGKELGDLKHSHSKLKKMVADKTTELAHAVRRAEQYETEVKRLRSRVEELKRELAVAEDEIDSATNNIRKLQRSNDVLQEQVQVLEVQVKHLQTRQRNTSISHRSPVLRTDEASDDD
ncbi:coiled-coil domain-containing protein 102A isoform X2 [Macrosteles quadrilineatus]|uniref:coiled-coil domain-containing protein 102A isoform X2 n=1 Tax=Macrosteles quadrilineatus TaxID=74068 RepID=UPI0023E09A4D|nr:coiled-coil domain-containing protein 102A isoform X2 [Macrosteles quadrilineatus]